MGDQPAAVETQAASAGAPAEVKVPRTVIVTFWPVFAFIVESVPAGAAGFTVTVSVRWVHGVVAATVSAGAAAGVATGVRRWIDDDDLAAVVGARHRVPEGEVEPPVRVAVYVAVWVRLAQTGPPSGLRGRPRRRTGDRAPRPGSTGRARPAATRCRR